MVRALASHQCVPGSIHGPGVICWLNFSPGFPVFLPSQKLTFLNSNSIGNSKATGLPVNLFIYLFIYLFVCLFIYFKFQLSCSTLLFSQSLIPSEGVQCLLMTYAKVNQML